MLICSREESNKVPPFNGHTRVYLEESAHSAPRPQELHEERERPILPTGERTASAPISTPGGAVPRRMARGGTSDARLSPHRGSPRTLAAQRPGARPTSRAALHGPAAPPGAVEGGGGRRYRLASPGR